MDLCTKLSITIMISPYFMESPLCWFAPEHHSFRTRQKKTSPLPVSRWRRRRTTTARKEFSTFNRRRRQHRLPVPFFTAQMWSATIPKRWQKTNANRRKIETEQWCTLQRVLPTREEMEPWQGSWNKVLQCSFKISFTGIKWVDPRYSW